MRDQLLRAQRYYGQNKIIECIGVAIMVLRAIGDATPATEVASALRDLMNLLGNNADVVAIAGKKLTFSTGQEKVILAGLAQVFKVMMANKDKEDHAAAMERKLNIDKYFNEGMRCIKENKISDAPEYFDKAITYYKDEHSLFALIGKAFMDAGAPKRAFPYLSKGVIALPNDEGMNTLYEACLAVKDKK